MWFVALVAFLAWSSTAAIQPSVGPGECFILAPLSGATETVAGGAECARRTLPASTFKIPHALVALETGVIAADTVMKWDGSPQNNARWQQDYSLDGAIKWSVVWFFQRAARAIGREREMTYLRAFSYGSQTFTREVDPRNVWWIMPLLNQSAARTRSGVGHRPTSVRRKDESSSNAHSPV